MVWAILGWMLLALAIALLAVVALPIELAVKADTGARPRLRTTLRLLGGLTPPIAFSSAGARRSGARKPAKGPKRPKRRGRSKGGPPARMIRQAPRLVLDLLRRITLHRLALDLRLGFDDPATTGEVYGLLLACAGPLRGRPNVDIALAPSFEGAVFDSRAELALRVTPLALVPPALGFAWRSFGPVR